ncbi:uncharacterized protein Z518_08571 [Rhinocladiella mackenziei CBS 650.93]|uniref:Uncharacterized protein n=1 Tax=Rhinocladiella mackenziei CBS 650.93 TaxID=1442369 RepID=A0A0D2I9R4_9EURO|nr:uncharacterized protein Z518_08571 [Rhinocladiella mackenziei CBS 650.93]KIX02629.1 hypothetical protein Z518_08571 [Rhinocladiella mackenziei CBS 650.93]
MERHHITCHARESVTNLKRKISTYQSLRGKKKQDSKAGSELEEEIDILDNSMQSRMEEVHEADGMNSKVKSCRETLAAKFQILQQNKLPTALQQDLADLRGMTSSSALKRKYKNRMDKKFEDVEPLGKIKLTIFEDEDESPASLTAI